MGLTIENKDTFPMPKALASATARRARLRVKPAWRLNAKPRIGGFSHG